ncbi:cilium assembly protein DZIP1 isoform 1-T7 [Clarias gariepinus]
MSGTNLPAPFKFCTRRESVDWRRINAIDVDRVSGELDFQMLQEHIAGVAFCSLEGERCLNCQSHVDPALLKLFRLAQLTIQYLLHSQDCLALSLQTAQEQLQIEAKEKQHLQVQLQKQCQDGKLLKEELKQRKKIIASQQAMISAGLANYHKCQHCEKAFMNISFLQSHMKRRHPLEHDIKRGTDNQKDLQTIKLQEEIIRLQDQLTLAKSEMETQQKDYNIKQEKDLTQKQVDFMKQLEIWKENERVQMKSKIDDVKQACRREIDSIHQKNRNLEEQLLRLQQSSKMQESMQLERGQTCSVQNSEDKHKEEVAQLRQKLHNQEIKWTTKMQKIKEECEDEKNQLQNALTQTHLTISKEKKRLETQVAELELRLEEQQQINTSQQLKIKYFNANSSKPTVQQKECAAVAAAPGPKKRVVSEQSSLVYKLDPIVELSEEDRDSSSYSESLANSQSRKQKVVEQLKNPSLKRDMHIAVQQSLNDKLLHIGIESAVDGISKTEYKTAMVYVLSERQQRQRDYAEYQKIQKFLRKNLDIRVKERSTRTIAKPKQSVLTLPQARPRTNSLPIIVTQVVSDPSARQQYASHPGHHNSTATRTTTSTQMASHRTAQSSLDQDSSEDDNLDKEFSQAPKITVKSHSPVQWHTASAALATFQKVTQSSGSHQAPAFSIGRMEVTLPESTSEWTEGSEMEEISLDELQENTEENRNVPKTSCSYVKALSNNLEQQLADVGSKKLTGVAIPDNPTGVINTNDDVMEVKHNDFEDNNDDDWDISSLEDVPVAHQPSSAPVRKSMDKSLNTSTSVWGTLTGKGEQPGLKDTGSTLKSSILTVSDWDDSDCT